MGNRAVRSNWRNRTALQDISTCDRVLNTNPSTTSELQQPWRRSVRVVSRRLVSRGDKLLLAALGVKRRSEKYGRFALRAPWWD